MIDKSRVAGPLASYAAGFGAELTRLGYAPRSTTALMGLMGELSRWLETEGLDAAGLTADVGEEFLRARGDAGSWRPTGKTLLGLLGYLRGLGVAPRPGAPVVRTSLDGLLERYRRYLVEERGLVEGTIDNYLHTARLFLSGWVGDDDGRVELEGLRVADVTAFVARRSTANRSTGSTRVPARELRPPRRRAPSADQHARPLRGDCTGRGRGRPELPSGRQDLNLRPLDPQITARELRSASCQVRRHVRAALGLLSVLPLLYFAAVRQLGDAARPVRGASQRVDSDHAWRRRGLGERHSNLALPHSHVQRRSIPGHQSTARSPKRGASTSTNSRLARLPPDRAPPSCPHPGRPSRPDPRQRSLPSATSR